MALSTLTILNIILLIGRGSIKNLVEEGKFPIRRTAIGYFKEVKYTNKGGCPLQGPVFVLHSY